MKQNKFTLFLERREGKISKKLIREKEKRRLIPDPYLKSRFG